MDEYIPEKKFMYEAIRVAHLARGNGDYSIGAVTVKCGEIIAHGENRVKQDNDPTAHSEIVAIRKTAEIFGSRHLEGVILYSTHEPCSMCTSAAVWAKIRGIVSGTYISDMSGYRNKIKSNEWRWRTINVSPEHIVENTEDKLFLIRGFLRDECIKLFHSY